MFLLLFTGHPVSPGGLDNIASILRGDGSLLLGLYDNNGLLQHVGFTSSLPAASRAELTRKLRKLIRPPTFSEPLLKTTLDLVQRVQGEFVLLGSIATNKYTGPLLQAMGERLLFPREFVGRGDMSRGGLMLRSARSGNELTYIELESASRRGRRHPKLDRIPR